MSNDFVKEWQKSLDAMKLSNKTNVLEDMIKHHEDISLCEVKRLDMFHKSYTLFSKKGEKLGTITIKG